MKARRAVLLAVAVVVLAGVVITVRVGYVRMTYGEWGLGPSATPPRFSFEGRDYRRAEGLSALPPGHVVVGHIGDGDLYGPPHWPYAPTGLELRTSGGVTDYSLAGGP